MSSLLGSRWTVLLVCCAAVLSAACGGDESDDPPQIQPHQWPVAFQNFGVETCNDDGRCGGGETCASCPGDCQDPVCQGSEEFQVILMNTGDGTLDITAMEVRGDVHCALTPPPEFDRPLPIHLTNEDNAFLNMTYIPGGSDAGQVGTKDQISIAITSNSNESPVFEISVCGCVIEGTPTPDEPGPNCACDLGQVPPGNCGG